ncbi:hypothetical protein AUP68_02098 [Ilyonectria robusta]
MASIESPQPSPFARKPPTSNRALPRPRDSASPPDNDNVAHKLPTQNETTARHIATSTLPIRQRLLRSGKHSQHVVMRPWDESIQGLTQGTARRAAGSPRRLVQHTCADGAVEGSYVGCNSRSRLSMHSK